MQSVAIYTIKEEYEAYRTGMTLYELEEPNQPYYTNTSGEVALPLGYSPSLKVHNTPVSYFLNEEGEEVGIIYSREVKAIFGSPQYFISKIETYTLKNDNLVAAGDEQRKLLDKAAKRIVTLENKLNTVKRKNDRNIVQRFVYLFTGV